MSSLTRKVASALSFAHLAGFAGKARAEGDDPDDKEKKDQATGDDPKNDKEAKGAKADDDERKQRDDESDDEYAKRMKAMDDQEAEDEERNKDAKADDDSDEEMRGNGSAAAARRRERARCATIFGSRAAGKNPVLAANLAFNTAMTRKEALAVLEGTPAPAASVTRRNPSLDASGGTGQTRAQAMAASWDTALAAGRGNRK